MSSKNKKDNQYSKKILKILGQKPAVSMLEINEKLHNPSLPPLIKGGENATHLFPPDKGARGLKNYAITRSLKGLREAGLIEQVSSPQNAYARLTKEGKKKMHSLQLDNENTLVNTSWDGYWRIVILDLPEIRKNEREALRYLLKKANFVCIKNTVWISPHPYEYLFTNIKKDLNLSTELMIIVTDKLDPETNKSFLEEIRNN